MKIKIIKGVACSPWYLSALVGDKIELDDKQANELIQAGRAEAIEEAPKPKKAKKEAE